MRTSFARLAAAIALLAAAAAAFAQTSTIYTVTKTAAGGEGSLTGVIEAQFAACPAESIIRFAIPAATDPGCDPATGICVVQIPDNNFGPRCSNTVVDGYSQPGASPNTATDHTNNAQIRIELSSDGPDANKVLQVYGSSHPFGYNPIFNVTFRGIAFPRHQLVLRPNNSGSVTGPGGGHVVAGNWFGWHANGARATGNVSRGVLFYGHWMENVRVGGSAPADRNLFTFREVSLCCEAGAVAIRGSGAYNALIEGNFFNVAPDGQPVATNGVVAAINLDSNGNTPASQDSVVRNNVIRNASSTPVSLWLGPGITMSRNLISGHPPGLPAWSFYTAAQGGANAQDAPALSGVTQSSAHVRVAGTVTSVPGRTVRIELFHNADPYQGNAGRTERFAGEVDVTVDGSGNGSFESILPADTRNVAASATDLLSGETSLLNAVPPPVTIVTDTAPAITSAAPPNGNLGATYTHAYTASGTAPIAWSVISGSLPPGLTLGTAGALTGTPTVRGTFNFTVQAANGTSPNATQAGTVVIGRVLYTLTVQKLGSGSGKVVSSVGGIDCGASCSARLEEFSSVRLTAIADPGSIFVGWTNICTTLDTPCETTMFSDRTVGATFAPVAQLTVRATGGNGIDVGAPVNRVCRDAVCVHDVPASATIVLTALPATYKVLQAWTGSCSGSQPTCSVEMSAARDVGATFVQKRVVLTVTNTGGAAGTITGSGFACHAGSTCTKELDAGPSYVLTALPGAGVTFEGWTGPCVATTERTCTVELGADRAITGRFSQPLALTVEISGPATVVSDQGPLACSDERFGHVTCTGQFLRGTTVTLRAVPAASDWTGCTASGSSCTVVMDQARSVTMHPAGRTWPMDVTFKHGEGTVVVGNAGGQLGRCVSTSPTRCVANVYENDLVTFSATPQAGYAFMAWLLHKADGNFASTVGCGSGPRTECTFRVPAPDTPSQVAAMPVRVEALIVKIPAAIIGVATTTAPALSRTTRVGTPFSPSPVVKVTDAAGAPIPGVDVLFAAVPGPNGASGTSPGGNPIFPAFSGADGTASTSVLANGIAGPWTLRVTTRPGSLPPLDIAMNNTNDPVPITLPGSGTATVPASGVVGVRLTIQVRGPQGQAVPGARVQFSVPPHTFPGGSLRPSGTVSPAVTNTDARGRATTTLTGNGGQGSFTVTVRVTLPRSMLPGAAGGFEGDDYVTEITVQATEDVPGLLDPAGDADSDGIPNAVEDAEGTLVLDKDNDIFNEARLFAMQQYRDFLGREGDAGGIDFWAAQLESGAQSRGQMVQTFLDSPEFQGTGAPIARLYFAYFLRIPDYGGLTHWIAQFRAGMSIEAISNAFAASEEFGNTYGALTNAQFVARVYQNILGRAPDAGGAAHWTGRLEAGMTRGQLMAQFSESTEYRDLIAHEIAVTMIYAGMLRRAPDAGGFAFWVDHLDGGNSGQALIQPFVSAPEYRNRFLP